MLLAQWFQLVGNHHTVEIFGVRLIGVDGFNLKRLAMSLALIGLIVLINRLFNLAARWVFRESENRRLIFWVRQGINVLLALMLVVGILSIWFEDSTRMATFGGLVTAGVAFALQQVITALAGYIVILRGKTLNVGDRIVMGGVRGDVIALGFIQTTIMEMGQPPPVQSAEPAQWVKARQYTGRIVTLSNAMIFSEPVYNYTRDFPYIWEELGLPVSYKDDRAKAEQILLDAARRHGVDPSSLDPEAVHEMRRRYGMDLRDMNPRVYWQLTDNWLELTVRFIVRDHGVREVKDAMSREILAGLDRAGVGIASSTYDIVGFPPIRVIQERAGHENGKPALPPPMAHG